MESDGLVPQAEQELARRVRVVEGSVRARLNESHLAGQQRQAVASRAGQQDSGNVQRVEDLLRFVPQARGLEKLDVQPRAVPHRLPSSKEVRKAAES